MSLSLRTFAIADIHFPDNFRMMELSPDQFDLVLTLGDISAETLDYILFMARYIECVVGIPGNHDPKIVPGLDDLHCRVIEYKGIRIGGFGGANREDKAAHHYSEATAAKKMRKMPAVDLFISHAPPASTAVNEGPMHRGFQAFDDYIAKHQPRYWLHGHLHKRNTQKLGRTEVISIIEKHPLTLDFD